MNHNNRQDEDRRDCLVIPLPSISGGNNAELSPLVHLVGVLRRRKVLVMSLTVLGIAVAIGMSVVETRQYQARATVEVQPFNENYLNMKSIDPTASGEQAGTSYLQTQVKLLQSRTLLNRISRRLHLQERQDFQLQPSRSGGLLRSVGLSPSGQPTIREHVLQTLQDNLKVQPSSDTRIIEITFTWGSPELAADVANALAREYVDQNMEIRWNAAQRTSDWLTPKLEEIRRNLEHSEDDLQAYARSSGVVFTAGEQDSAAEMQFLQLQEELSKAQAERVIRQTQYEISRNTSPETLPRGMDEGPLREYAMKLSDLRRQLAELEASYTPAHYKVRHAEAQIRELESSQAKEREQVGSRIQGGYEVARRREELLKQSYLAQAQVVSDQAAKIVRYRILKNEVKTNQELYAAMMRETKEAGIASTMHANNLRIVDEAESPSQPFKPSVGWHLAMGLLLGVFAGVGAAFAKDSAIRTIQRPGEAPACLHLPELGTIPSAVLDRYRQIIRPRSRPLKQPRAYSILPTASPLETGAAPEVRAGRPGLELVTWNQPPSLMAESFRSTVASIRFSDQGGSRPRLLVLTSAGPGEGKTTVTTNLGIALAELGQRVLLIDADVRKPRLHSIFGIPIARGLTAVLSDSRPIADYSYRELGHETDVPDLFVIPCGPVTDNIFRLLNSGRMIELLQRLRNDYDTILVDTPPSLQFSHARIFGRLADATIIIVRAGQTDRASAIAVAQRFKEDNIPVLGTVLNDFNPKSSDGYDYGYNSYYQSHDKAADSV